MTEPESTKRPSPLKQKLLDLLTPIVAHHGVELFDLHVMKRSRGHYLQIFIDRLDGEVLIEDCEKVSRHIELILDESLILGDRYTLEVGSPGLDRPLRNPTDCRRFVGRLAKVVFVRGHQPQTAVGVLEAVEGDNVALRTDDDELIRAPWSEVSRAHLEVELFRPDETKPKKHNMKPKRPRKGIVEI